MAEPDPRHTNVPHPFWGDPPDIAICVEWMGIVLATHEKVQSELSVARVGGRVTDEDGHVITHEAYAAWRAEKLRKKNTTMARYRWLKEWSQQHGGVPKKAGVPLRTLPTRPAADTDRLDNGVALRVAVKRYGRLERLYDTLRAYVADEDESVSWEAVMAAMDACDTSGAER